MIDSNTDSMNGADNSQVQSRLVAAGGILGAILASSCCILPLIFLSLGISGAWMGNLTAMAPYQPIFTLLTFAFLGYGYYLVYWKSKVACVEGEACATPTSNRTVKISLFAGTLLVMAATLAQYLPAEFLEFL